MNTKTYSPCVLVRAVQIIKAFINIEDGPVLVRDVITGETLNTWASELHRYTYQGSEHWLMLEKGEAA